MPLLIESVNKPAVEKVAPLTPISVNVSPGFDLVFIVRLNNFNWLVTITQIARRRGLTISLSSKSV